MFTRDSQIRTNGVQVTEGTIQRTIKRRRTLRLPKVPTTNIPSMLLILASLHFLITETMIKFQVTFAVFQKMVSLRK